MSQKIIPTSLRADRNSGTEMSVFMEKNHYAKIWASHWSLRRWGQLILQSHLRFRHLNAPSRFRRKKSLFSLSKIWTKSFFNKVEMYPLIRGSPRTGLIWKYSPIRVPSKKKNKSTGF
jgi:hypothetical protein